MMKTQFVDEILSVFQRSNLQFQSLVRASIFAGILWACSRRKPENMCWRRWIDGRRQVSEGTLKERVATGQKLTITSNALAQTSLALYRKKSLS